MQAVKQVQNMLGGPLEPGSQQAHVTPHKAQFASPLEPGEIVSIKGVVGEIDVKGDGLTTFYVNLSSSNDGDNSSNIPLHISVRFKEREVVFNTLQGGDWGKEERKKLPFEAGKPFDLRIRAHGDKYEIFADGKAFLEYDHRVPMSQVSHIFINGPIRLHSVTSGGGFCPVPYINPLAPFAQGRKLFLTAQPHKDAKAFNFNLKLASGDIAFHFNPRFGDKEVVRNTCTAGSWGAEEKEGDFTFVKNTIFDVAFVNTGPSVKVFLNDVAFCTYAHRVDVNDVNALEVQGDVNLLSVHYE